MSCTLCSGRCDLSFLEGDRELHETHLPDAAEYPDRVTPRDVVCCLQESA